MRLVKFVDGGGDRLIYPAEGIDKFGITVKVGGEVIGEYFGNAAEEQLATYVGEWPIVNLKYKTRDLVKSDIQDMLTPTEKILFAKVRANVDGNLSFLPSAAVIDNDARNPKYPGATWRDLLRSAIDEYNDADTYNVDHPSYLPGWSLMAGLGILDNPARVNDMMLGLKLT